MRSLTRRLGLCAGGTPTRNWSVGDAIRAVRWTAKARSKWVWAWRPFSIIPSSNLIPFLSSEKVDDPPIEIGWTGQKCCLNARQDGALFPW